MTKQISFAAVWISILPFRRTGKPPSALILSSAPCPRLPFMKTFTLDVDYDFDFQLFGIISSSKEHKVAWHLNRFFRIRLTKQQDMVFDYIHKGKLVISNYLYKTEHSTLRLLKNKSAELTQLKKPFLLPEIKDYDYVLVAGGAMALRCSEQICNMLRSMEVVEYVKEFEPDTFQYKENLLF